jgi:hypothetical protein
VHPALEEVITDEGGMMTTMEWIENVNADARIAYLLALTEKVMDKIEDEEGYIQTRKTIDIKLSPSLQKVRISNVMQKLNVKGRSQAVVELVRLGELKI